MAINRVFAGLATADCPAALAWYERSSPTPLSVPAGSLPIPSPRPQRSGRNQQLGVTMTADDARGLTLTRTFDARRQLVWDAYTVPELLARWWGPSIMHTPLETITVDLRPSGPFRLTMVSDIDGTQYPSEMVIREVVPMFPLMEQGTNEQLDKLAALLA